MPRQRSSGVPRRWASFRIKRQKDPELCSAMLCIVAAGTHLGTLKNNGRGMEQVCHQLANKAWAGDELPDDMLTPRCTEKGLRAMATAAGLSMWRPNRRADGLGDLAWRDD